MYEEQIEISKILQLPYRGLLEIIGKKSYFSTYEKRKLFEHINALNVQFKDKKIDIEKVFTNNEKINLKTLLFTNEMYNLQLVKQILISKIKTNV